MKILGIIPSRYASTRFPGKPLAMIGGKTMIRRVYERASQAFEDVVVATDDDRIFNEVNSFGGRAVMTSENHQSGTDRCAEAAVKYSQSTGKQFNAVINIQGDEPFVDPDQLRQLGNLFNDSSVEIATLVKQAKTSDEVFSENTAKVIVNNASQAVYFSRSPIPFYRGKEREQWVTSHVYYRHIGVYAYRSDILQKITLLPQSPLELAERLEQNRWIENGYNIKVCVTDFEGLAVDTPEDLDKILKTIPLTD
ncbi:MAG: 3-deoxy-manno-octulosonate cytidylyltransferase [Bacteroidales bacterium]|nr:3-deoxy-manno-octulosonate cytidylyltransferase [Bacteroidales bacterium]